MTGNRVGVLQDKYLLNIVMLDLTPLLRKTNQPSIARADTFKCIGFYLIKYYFFNIVY
jgi:hypothetical protein